MKNTISIDPETVATISISLRMEVSRAWKQRHGHDAFVRPWLKNTIRALRIIRGSSAIYSEAWQYYCKAYDLRVRATL